MNFYPLLLWFVYLRCCYRASAGLIGLLGDRNCRSEPEESKPSIIIISEPEDNKPSIIILPEPEENKPIIIIISEPEDNKPSIIIVSEPEDNKPSIIIVSELEDNKPSIIIVSEPEDNKTSIIIISEPEDNKPSIITYIICTYNWIIYISKQGCKETSSYGYGSRWLESQDLAKNSTIYRLKFFNSLWKDVTSLHIIL